MRGKQVQRAVLAGMLLSVGFASAATQWWDTSTNANVQGGTGIWSTVDAFWATNSTTASGSGPFTWTNGNDAVFAAAAVSTVTVMNVSVGALNITGAGAVTFLDGGAGALALAGGVSNVGATAVFNNAIALANSQTWTLTQPTMVNGAITGAFALVKAGTGTLTFSNANTFSGGLSVPLGTVTGYGQAAGSPFGTGTLSIGGASSASANGAAGLTLIGLATPTIAANGDLVANGSWNSGTLAVTAPAAGATTLQCANLVRNGRATLAIAPGAGGLGVTNQITFTGNGSTLTNGILTPWMVVTNNNGDFLTYAATGLTNVVYATRFDSNLTTQVVSLAGTTNLAAPQVVYALKLGQNINLNGKSLTVGDGVTAGMILKGNSITNGGADASLNLGNAEALVYVDTGLSGTIGVPIAGTGGLTKFGAGTLTLSGTNFYSGDTALQAGTLSWAPAADSTYGGAICGAGTLGKSGAKNMTLTGSTSSVGSVTVSAGTLTVDGGALTNLSLTWAGAAAGTLIATNGGQFFTPNASNTTLKLTGNVTLTGTNPASGQASTFNLGRASLLSFQGANLTLTVDSGAVVSNGAAMIIAYNDDGNSVQTNDCLVITNGGRVALSGYLYVGYRHNGGSGNDANNRLVVTGSNAVTGVRSTLDLSNGGLGVGYQEATSSCKYNTTLVANGGIITNAGALGVPWNYQGGDYNTLTVTNGGQLFTSSTIIGAEASYCSVQVVGVGARWNNNNGGITVGRQGGGNSSSSDQLLVSGVGAVVTNAGSIGIAVPASGNTLHGHSMIVTNGGKLFSTGTTIGSSGNGGGSSANYTIVTGPSLWDCGSGGITVGNATWASSMNNWLWILNGGTVTNAAAITLGVTGSGSANGNSLVISNAATLISAGAVSVGLGQNSGYSANTNSALIAGGPLGNSLWDLGRTNLTVGNRTATGSLANSNTLTVASGGILTNAGVLTVGISSTTGNTATVTGGSLSVSNLVMNAGVGSLFTFNSGLVQLQRAAVTNGLPCWVGDGGATPAELNLNGGTNASQALSFFNGLVITNNGVLSGSGRIVSPTTIAGTLAPGGVGATTSIVFTSNLTLTATAVVKIDLSGRPLTSNDWINATGQMVDLGGATLQVSLAPGYMPARTDVFTNLVAGVLSNSFGNLVGGRAVLTQPAATMTISTTGNRVILSGYSLSSGTCVLFQ